MEEAHDQGQVTRAQNKVGAVDAKKASTPREAGSAGQPRRRRGGGSGGAGMDGMGHAVGERPPSPPPRTKSVLGWLRAFVPLLMAYATAFVSVLFVGMLCS